MPLYIADFETTVDEDTTQQEYTEVWSFAIAQLFDGTENVTIGNSIEDFFREMKKGKRRSKKIVYFHNLAFDGKFIIDYLSRKLGFKADYDEVNKKYNRDKEIRENAFSCVITDQGIWYSIEVNFDGYLIEFRDSLKLLPFKLVEIGPAFNTKHRKLKMKYKGNMHAGGEITQEQRAYITNDILCPKEALEAFLTEIDKKKSPPLTIGQWALSTFKHGMTKAEYNNYFPNLKEIKLDINYYGSADVDAYIRKSYMGGWCYADERYTGLVNKTTKIYDVNSLYPSMMREHNNPMPVGEPVMIKDIRKLKDFPKDCYYFIRFRCQFELKDGYLPFIQLKHDLHYRSNENLKYSKWDRNGDLMRNYTPEITLSKTLFNLFVQSYKIWDLEILDAAVFNVEYGLFDGYVDHFMAMKIKATKEKNHVKRQVAKLALNNLYGKFGRNPENAFRVPDLKDEDMEVLYDLDIGEDNKPVYIPIASAITSYARRFTVKAAIQNIDYFRYSDTDSIHLVCNKNYIPKGITIDDVNLSCWAEEGVVEHSIFVRQKTYMEWSGSDFDIKGCGMPDRCKMLFEQNLKGNKPVNNKLKVIGSYEILEIEDGEEIDLSLDELDFLETEREPEDYKIGFSVPGKLTPRTIVGGCVLEEGFFTIH